MIIFRLMGKTDFAKAVIARISSSIGKNGNNYSSASATAAMNAVAAAITEYLISHVAVAVSYSGVIPGTPPTPDPIASDVFKIVGACTPPSPSQGFDEWIANLETSIISGFTLAPQGNAGVVFAQRPFINAGVSVRQSDLKSMHNPQDTNPQQQIWETVCDSIIRWLSETSANTVPGAASRPAASSTGMASITRITVT